MLTPIVLDIETTSKWDHIYHAVTTTMDGVSTVHWTLESLSQLLSSQDWLMVGHNIIKFDIPKLAEHWDIHWTGGVFDTYVVSRLLNPNMEGGHSLRNWGEIVGAPKDNFTDYNEPMEGEQWEGWQYRMACYCIQDTVTNRDVYLEQKKRLTSEGFSEFSVQLEHDVAQLTYQQEKNGFKLDDALSEEWEDSLIDTQNTTRATLQEVFEPIITQRWSEKTGKRLKDGVEVFNVGSRQQVARRLTALGAEFTEKTEKGQTIINETTLSSCDLPEAALVNDYLTATKLLGMVSAWRSAAEREPDGRVRGRVNTIGAITRRMTHSSPNMGQIPSLPIARRCWTVEDGNVLVGADASGLELRCLAHYMQDPDYTAQILDGDIHTYNQNMAGLETRSQAKTFIYALLYGAGDAKIGSIVGGGAKEGAKLRASFMRNLPAYAELVAKVKRIMKKNGTLPTLDGGRVHVRSEHAALNTQLQSAGAVVMKVAAVDSHQALHRYELPFKLVAQVHDEFQVEVVQHLGGAVGRVLVEGIRNAGDILKMRCPMDGEFKIGSNWSMTH